MHLKSLAPIVLLLALTLPPTAAAQEADRLFDVAGAPNDSMVFAFLHTLQVAVVANDSQAVARLIHYPLRINDSLHTTWIRNPRQFQRLYRSILTPPIRAAILAQIGDSLFANWQGVMIGRGQVWMNFSCPENVPAECERLGISAINRNAPGLP